MIVLHVFSVRTSAAPAWSCHVGLRPHPHIGQPGEFTDERACWGSGHVRVLWGRSAADPNSVEPSEKFGIHLSSSIWQHLPPTYKAGSGLSQLFVLTTAEDLH